nr:undecaprenyl diphosphate synthase family protein [Actinomycetes bacterium]
MGLKDLVYGIYERNLAAHIPPERMPRHVGVILDGNRRWATAQGSTSAQGHAAGAAKIVDFLGWCD